MNCWSDQTLHWAVRRLLDTGADVHALLRGDALPPEGCDSSLRETLEHIRDCSSCILTARDLLETELELLAGEQVERMIQLLPTPSWSPPATGDVINDQEPAEYAVAADSCGTGERISLDGHGAISLASRDGRYLVRIFRNEGDAGATAVLLRTTGPGDADGDESAHRISICIGGEDYTFDPDGTVKLPAFPASPPSLILRSS